MAASPTEPIIVRRLKNRYKPSVKAFIVSTDDWDYYFRWLTPAVQNLYHVHGFYDIDPQTGAMIRGKFPNLGVIAMTWKGLPVVSYVDASKVLLQFGRKDVVVL